MEVRSPAAFDGVAALPFDLSGQYGSNHANHGGCCAIAAEILTGYRQMRALIAALDTLDQLESSAAHSAAIMAFELAALSPPWAREASLHRDNDVVK